MQGPRDFLQEASTADEGWWSVVVIGQPTTEQIQTEPPRAVCRFTGQ